MFYWEMEVPSVVGDNSIPINAAIAILSAGGGGTVYLGPSIYTVAGSILRQSNVRIKGAFNGSGIWDAFSSSGTIVKWTGSAGGTVFLDAPGLDQKPVLNGGISDLTIDCGGGIAAYGLQSLSTSYAEYKRLHCVGAYSQSYYFGTLNTPVATLNYRTRLDSLSSVATGSANGFVLDGVPGSGRNTCFMTATNLTAAFLNGCGFSLPNADDNVFVGCSASLIHGGSGGAGVYFGGSSDGGGKAANANQFYGFWTNGYINSAGGSTPSRGNIVYTSCMDGKPLIYQQAGSDLTVVAVSGEPGLNGFVRNPIPAG